MNALRALACLAAIGCEPEYPEVVITNQTSETTQLRRVSFSGCAWEGVLAFGESTVPGRCLPGRDRVHFQKLDAAQYCRDQAEESAVDGLCPCERDSGDAGAGDGLTNAEPMWFSYQTASAQAVDYGEFHRFEITLSELEQDFSIPGPYGH